VEREITALARRKKHNVVFWDCVAAFSGDRIPKAASQQQYKMPLQALLQAVDANPCFLEKGEDARSEGTLIVMRNLKDFWIDPSTRRQLKTICEQNLLSCETVGKPRTLILVAPFLDIHKDLQSCITVVEFTLPDETAMRNAVRFVRDSAETTRRRDSKLAPADAVLPLNEELEDKLSRALLGLTAVEAENLVSRCLIIHREFKEEMLRTVLDEKAAVIGRSQVLSYISESKIPAIDEIGGYDDFFAWIRRRARAYDKGAREIKLDYPKGAVLIGIPGSGKSVVATVAGRLLRVPVYSMDVGAIFGSLVGESEQRMRDALKQVEAQQGCVLLLDEADKAIAGVNNSTGDSGVTKRVMGNLLSWLADKRDRTFVIMTLNRTKEMPTEFLRAGRFDAVFSVDVPDDAERKQILEIHFRKRGVDPAALNFDTADWKMLIEQTSDYVGSELEQIVKESRYLAYEQRNAGLPNMEEMMAAIHDVIPLARRDKEGVAEIRKLAEQDCRPVSAGRGRAPRRRQRSVDAS
jgi:SpoVK/Ycf46/Vps4 family AAA+-type ATPase